MKEGRDGDRRRPSSSLSQFPWRQSVRCHPSELAGQQRAHGPVVSDRQARVGCDPRHLEVRSCVGKHFQESLEEGLKLGTPVAPHVEGGGHKVVTDGGAACAVLGDFRRGRSGNGRAGRSSVCV